MFVLDRGRLLTAAVTLAIAIGAGHVMQYGFAGSDELQQPAPRPSSPRPQSSRSQAATLMFSSPLLTDQRAAGPEAGLPDAPDAVLDPIGFPVRKLVPMIVPDDGSRMTRDGGLSSLDAIDPDCLPAARAEAAPGAIIRIDLETCMGGVPILIDHAGLAFSAMSGSDGRFSTELPAFDSDALVRVTVGGAHEMTLQVDVPDAVWYDRVALSWEGRASLAIHAFEMGAGPGTPGHVSASHPRTPERGAAAEGGFLMRFGDLPPRGGGVSAEVYSFPTGRIPGQGTVRLAVSVTVTDEACGKELPVRVLRSLGASGPRKTIVPVAFPGCESAGSILVLKNLLEDLRIAQN